MDQLEKAFDLEVLKNYLLTRGLSLAVSLLAAIAIFVAGRILSRVAARTLSRLLERSGTDVTLVKFLDNITYSLLLAFTVVAAVEKLGVNTTSFAAIVGAAGLAIGLSLQSSLSNFACGVMIILHHHFRVGDRIEAGGQSGLVDEIQVFSSILRAEDGTRIILPNSAVLGGTIKVFPRVGDKIGEKVGEKVGEKASAAVA